MNQAKCIFLYVAISAFFLFIAFKSSNFYSVHVCFFLYENFNHAEYF